MNNDELTICNRCQSDACYVNNLGADYKVYMCYGCGFTTNTLMKQDSEFLKEQLEVLPELYKDLAYQDDQKNYWIPSTLNLNSKGMVYIDGTSTKDWKWAAIKSVSILEEERKNFPIPGSSGEFYENKMDMKSLKHFEERDFIEALDYIGMFEKE